MIDIRKELNDVVESVRNRFPDQSPLAQLARIATESAGLVGGVIGAMDEVESAADYKSLKTQVTAFAVDLISDVKVPWGMETFVPLFVSIAMSKLEQAGPGAVETVKDDYVRPFFQAFKDFGEAGLEPLAE